jgi:hypothetical protein
MRMVSALQRGEAENGPYTTTGSPGVWARRYDRGHDGRWAEHVGLLGPTGNLPFDQLSPEQLAEWRGVQPGQVLPDWAQLYYGNEWPEWHRPGALVRSHPELELFESPPRYGQPTAEILAPDQLLLQPLSETCGVFFPDVPRDQRDREIYPLPLSEQFWSSYAEPLYHFFVWSRNLELTLDLMGTTWGQDALRKLVGPVTPSVESTPDGLWKAWLSPSLLESFRNGTPPTAIAAELGTSPEVVRGWVKTAKADTLGDES